MVKCFTNVACCFILIFFMIGSAQAQISKPGITLGGYLVYSQPTGNFANAYTFGGGGEVFGGIGLGKTYIIATAGLSNFKPLSGSHEGTMTYTPVRIGLK